MMNRTLGVFIVASAITHALFFRFSGVIVLLPEEAAPPVVVSLLPEEVEINDVQLTGRVEDLPIPAKEETPDEAKILSRADSKAHSPEKGERYTAPKTAIPRERIDPSPPALVLDKKNVKEKKKKVAKTMVAALPKPKVDTKNKPAARELDLFSEEAIKKAIEPARERRIEKSKTKEDEKSKKLSTRITDRPAPPRPEMERPSGAPDVKGADIETYMMNKTEDVIDMGDEAVVSLDTRAYQYVDYFNSIKRAVEIVWTYPEEAIISGASGQSLLRFTINSKGGLEDVRLVNSSGRKILDDEALLAIKAAAPYNPFPANLNKKRLHIIAAFVYRPSYNAVR